MDAPIATTQAHTSSPSTPSTPSTPFSHKDIHLIQTTSLEIIHRTWSNSFPAWGTAFGAEKYFARETFLASQPFGSNGKQKFWVLVPKSFDPENPDGDLILSSLETFERPGIIATKEQGLRDVLSVSIASVYTPENHRKFGYASLMMKLLWKEIQDMDNVEFTFLYSDIGPVFYSRMGWLPKRSEEIIIPTAHSTFDDLPGSVALEYVNSHNLTQILEKDVQLLRESMQEQVNISMSNAAIIAVTPEPNCINWLNARSRFTAQKLDISLEGPNSIGIHDNLTNSFALWFHDFVHCKLYIVRWRVDTNSGDETTRSLLHAAQKEARKWALLDIVIWNPDQSVVDVLGSEAVKRDESISSVGMLTPGYESRNTEWVINEKYGWC
ncbi:hypothetical protein BGZ76_009361 [Entomortierella beljakovae]|nr:hypothetical protein BGZ76_009361 [Entomortierella beljakovae]